MALKTDAHDGSAVQNQKSLRQLLRAIGAQAPKLGRAYGQIAKERIREQSVNRGRLLNVYIGTSCETQDSRTAGKSNP
jgi:hypothetical protein